MKSFGQLIQEETYKLNELHVQIHETYASRGKSESGHRAWEKACELFRSYKSPLDEYFVRACEAESYIDKDLLEFVLRFLEINPWFFRSGYLKQIFLTKIKRSLLSEENRNRLRQVLMDAVNRRGTREYKYYCRLSVPIANNKLVSFLEEAELGSDSGRKARAALMLKYVKNHRQYNKANQRG